jgi:hypothetical protein
VSGRTIPALMGLALLACGPATAQEERHGAEAEPPRRSSRGANLPEQSVARRAAWWPHPSRRSGPGPEAVARPEALLPGELDGLEQGLEALKQRCLAQARAKAVDRWADIWAFGVVLYEALTGRRAFEGEELSGVLPAVLRQDIDGAALPATSSPRLRGIGVLIPAGAHGGLGRGAVNGPAGASSGSECWGGRV